MVIYGGADSNKAYNDLYILKTGSLDQKWEWKKITSINENSSSKHGHTFDIVGNEFISFGGTQNGEKYSNNLYTWTFTSEGFF